MPDVTGFCGADASILLHALRRHMAGRVLAAAGLWPAYLPFRSQEID